MGNTQTGDIGNTLRSKVGHQLAGCNEGRGFRREPEGRPEETPPRAILSIYLELSLVKMAKPVFGKVHRPATVVELFQPDVLSS